MNEVRVALFAELAADATLTALLGEADAIYHQVAPQDASPPYVVFNKMAGTPAWSFAGPPIDGDIWQVKAIDKSSSASTAEQIAARIDVVLTDAQLTITDRIHMYLRRESDVSYPEVVSGEVFRHEGARYRLFTEAA